MTRITKTDKNGEIFFFSMDHAFTQTYKFPIKKKKTFFKGDDDEKDHG